MTATLLRFPRHRRWTCTEAHDDGGMSCGFCSGELFSCATCGRTEGSLTTDCSGEPLTPEMERRVLAGELDWTVRDGWVVLRPPSREYWASDWTVWQPGESEVGFLQGAILGATAEIAEAMREVLGWVVRDMTEDRT